VILGAVTSRGWRKLPDLNDRPQSGGDDLPFPGEQENATRAIPEEDFAAALNCREELLNRDLRIELNAQMRCVLGKLVYLEMRS